MKKIIYTPFMKVLMTVILLISVCTFAYMTIFTYEMNSDKYSYKTINEIHQDIISENFESFAQYILSSNIKDVSNDYVAQWRINSINDTSEHNFRYIFSLDSTEIFSNFDNEASIYNENMDYDIIKVTYFDEEKQVAFSEYYLDAGELMWLDDDEIADEYYYNDIMWSENLLSTSSELYSKIPAYISRETFLADIETSTQALEIVEDMFNTETTSDALTQTPTYEDSTKNDYTVYAKVVGEYSIDAYYIANTDVIDHIAVELAKNSVNYELSKYYEVILLSSIILCGICSVGLLFSWGRKNGTEQIQTSELEKIPFDLYITISAIIASIPFVIYQNSYQTYQFIAFEIAEEIIPFICVGIASVVGFLAVRTTIIRFKARTIIKNTMLWKLLCLVAKPFEKPYLFVKNQLEEATIVSKVLFWAIVYAVISTILSLVISPFIFNILEKAILLPFLVALAVMLKKLKISGEILSKGDINHTIDTKYLFGDFKEHAENLNEIKYGLQESVSEQMKSERLKTELITNVSHDIKTPLTSIINYVDLISKEETENEKIKEYSTVLSKNSYRLKKLIEDLVSASKASTGNMEVNFEDVDLSMLLTQTIGEYSERFEENQLEVVATNITEPIIISADGKLIWRVLDNLFGNICKYSQQNTRVYLDVIANEKNVIINVKNISKYPLNLHSSELLERFVRGDSSRHTEGSGLGLSIAKSLVNLQKGTLDLMIDGDLFKVVITFDRL
ncbi:MAG: HAMP domain-containing sensor histidine kinase [Clostridia bacterium]